jgi:hypothetical protein
MARTDTPAHARGWTKNPTVISPPRNPSSAARASRAMLLSGPYNASNMRNNLYRGAQLSTRTVLTSPQSTSQPSKNRPRNSSANDINTPRQSSSIMAASSSSSVRSRPKPGQSFAASHDTNSNIHSEKNKHSGLAIESGPAVTYPLHDYTHEDLGVPIPRDRTPPSAVESEDDPLLLKSSTGSSLPHPPMAKERDSSPTRWGALQNALPEIGPSTRRLTDRLSQKAQRLPPTSLQSDPEDMPDEIMRPNGPPSSNTEIVEVSDDDPISEYSGDESKGTRHPRISTPSRGAIPVNVVQERVNQLEGVARVRHINLNTYTSKSSNRMRLNGEVCASCLRDNTCNSSPILVENIPSSSTPRVSGNKAQSRPQSCRKHESLNSSLIALPLDSWYLGTTQCGGTRDQGSVDYWLCCDSIGKAIGVTRGRPSAMPACQPRFDLNLDVQSAHVRLQPFLATLCLHKITKWGKPVFERQEAPVRPVANIKTFTNVQIQEDKPRRFSSGRLFSR